MFIESDIELTAIRFGPAQQATGLIDHTGESIDWLGTGQGQWHPEPF